MPQFLQAIYISQEQLDSLLIDALLNDEATQNATLETYFDFVQLTPFSSAYRLKSNVIIPELEAEKGLVLDMANNISRLKKNRLFKKQRDKGLKVIVAEGDSWFEHPHPSVDEILTHLGQKYAVYSLAAGGDVLRNMFQKSTYLDAIRQFKAETLLISGGGNDILGEQFKGFLNAYTPGTPGDQPERFINQYFHNEMGSLEKIYDELIRQVLQEFPALEIIVHGYDYVIPLNVTNRGWLGRYMIAKGITDRADKTAIIKYIVDIFNDMLHRLADKYPQLRYIDVRGTVPDNRWYDEIHPTSAGFQDVAVKFMQVIS